LVVHLPLDEAGDQRARSVIRATDAKGKVIGTAVGTAGRSRRHQFDWQHRIDLGNVANFDRTDKFSFGAWINPAAPDARAMTRGSGRGRACAGIDLLISQGKLEAHLVNAWPANGDSRRGENARGPGSGIHVFVTYDGSSKAAGVKLYADGAPIEVHRTHDTLTAESSRAVPARRTSQKGSGRSRAR
jgi:hypothetical protein